MSWSENARRRESSDASRPPVGIVRAGRDPDEPSSRLLHVSEVGCFGEFRCPASCRAWEVENRIGAEPTIAFARDPVGIAQADRDPVVATPNDAMLYNAGQAYRRRLLSPAGDRCEFISIRPSIMEEVVAERGPRGSRVGGPLPWSWATIPASVYLAQRSVYHHLTEAMREDHGGGVLDPLMVDELLLTIASEVIAHAAANHPGRARRSATARDHRVWIEGAKEFLGANFTRSLSLQDVAEAVGLSMFHLCRLFKAHTGQTVHDYVRSLRVRASLEGLADASRSIADISAGLGFCNQSHFTRAFRGECGMTPSQARRALRAGALPEDVLRGGLGDGADPVD